MTTSVQDRSHLTHLHLRSRHGRFDVVLCGKKLGEFDRACVKASKEIAPDHRSFPLDALFYLYFKSEFIAEHPRVGAM